MGKIVYLFNPFDHSKTKRTVGYDNYKDNQGERNNETFFSKRLKAGKKRTYFFDVKSTRGNDFFITLTESKKRFNDSGYDRHKIFLYKEDFNKFLRALTETIDHVKTELMPDFDFDAFNHDEDEQDHGGYQQAASHSSESAADAGSAHEEDNW